MRSVGSGFLVESMKMHGLNPFVWLVEIVTSDAESIRLVCNTQNVTWKAKEYYAADFRISGVRQSKDGAIPTLQLSIPNTTLEGQALLDANDGLVDKKAWIRLVNLNDLSETTNVFEDRFLIQATTVTTVAIQFSLGRVDLYQKLVPKRRFFREVCFWGYKSRECGYSGSMSTCSKVLNGPTGCRAHGDDEVANGEERLHPKRFGAFPGILKERV